MKAIVLAGGFAKRLWPLTKELAKPLVDVGGRPIISYILSELDKSKQISEIFISTNAKFEESFNKWLKTQKFSTSVKIIAEPAVEEGKKFGAVGGINFVFEREKIDDDVMIIGGDNLIGINTDKIISEFEKKRSPIVAAFDIKNLSRMTHFGEMTIDDTNKIIRMREKPERPETTLASTCCYVFPKGISNTIKEYLSSGNNTDAPGHFVAWLASKTNVYAHIFDTYWFDIGDHETLERAREFVRTNMTKQF